MALDDARRQRQLARGLDREEEGVQDSRASSRAHRASMGITLVRDLLPGGSSRLATLQFSADLWVKSCCISRGKIDWALFKRVCGGCKSMQCVCLIHRTSTHTDGHCTAASSPDPSTRSVLTVPKSTSITYPASFEALRRATGMKTFTKSLNCSHNLTSRPWKHGRRSAGLLSKKGKQARTW